MFHLSPQIDVWEEHRRTLTTIQNYVHTEIIGRTDLSTLQKHARTKAALFAALGLLEAIFKEHDK